MPVESLVEPVLGGGSGGVAVVAESLFEGFAL